MWITCVVPSRKTGRARRTSRVCLPLTETCSMDARFYIPPHLTGCLLRRMSVAASDATFQSIQRILRRNADHLRSRERLASGAEGAHIIDLVGAVGRLVFATQARDVPFQRHHALGDVVVLVY